MEGKASAWALHLRHHPNIYCHSIDLLQDGYRPGIIMVRISEACILSIFYGGASSFLSSSGPVTGSSSVDRRIEVSTGWRVLWGRLEFLHLCILDWQNVCWIDGAGIFRSVFTGPGLSTCGRGNLIWVSIYCVGLFQLYGRVSPGHIISLFGQGSLSAPGGGMAHYAPILKQLYGSENLCWSKPG